MATGAGRQQVPIGGVLLALAMLATIPVLATNAWPVLSGAAQPIYEDRWTWILVHATGGTIALFSGAANLVIGTTRRGFAWHRTVGFVYLGSGTLMATAGSISRSRIG